MSLSPDVYGRAPVQDGKPEPVRDDLPKCECGRTLALYLTRPWCLKCTRCHKVVERS